MDSDLFRFHIWFDQNITLYSKANLYYILPQATQTFISELSEPVVTFTYQATVAEIAYLQLNLGMKVTMYIPGY